MEKDEVIKLADHLTIAYLNAHPEIMQGHLIRVPAIVDEVKDIRYAFYREIQKVNEASGWDYRD